MKEILPDSENVSDSIIIARTKDYFIGQTRYADHVSIWYSDEEGNELGSIDVPFTKEKSNE